MVPRPAKLLQFVLAAGKTHRQHCSLAVPNATRQGTVLVIVKSRTGRLGQVVGISMCVQVNNDCRLDGCVAFPYKRDVNFSLNRPHDSLMSAYKRVGVNMSIQSEEHKSSARKDVFQRIRFYACPYAVQKESILGRGFLFLQSDCTLAELSLPLPKSSSGRPIPKLRAILLHYLTVGEYDSEVCREDFELAACRSKLQEAVDEYNVETHVVVLMRFRCGHVALGVVPLVPDYAICKSLGRDYFENSTAGALQLNLDDL